MSLRYEKRAPHHSTIILSKPLSRKADQIQRQCFLLNDLVKTNDGNLNHWFNFPDAEIRDSNFPKI